MSSDSSTPHDNLLARLDALVHERFPEDQVELAARFVQLYYARVRTGGRRQR